MKWKQIVVWTSAIHASPGTRVLFAVFWDAQRSNARLEVWVNKQKRTSDHSCSSDEIGRARHWARRTTWFHQRTSSLSHLCSGASNRKDLEMKIKSGSMGQEDDFVLRLTFVFNVHASGWLNSTCDAESFEDEEILERMQNSFKPPRQLKSYGVWFICLRSGLAVCARTGTVSRQWRCTTAFVKQIFV